MFDLVLGALLVLAAVIGAQRGFTRSIAGLLGVIAGAAVAFAVVPGMSVSLQSSPVGILAIPLMVLFAVVAGHFVGALIGRLLHRGASALHIGVLDRILGMTAHVVVVGLTIAIVGASLSTVGNAQLSAAVGESKVILGISRVLPSPVRRQIAAWQSAVMNSGLPRVLDALSGLSQNPQLPSGSADSAALVAASRSVVRISGVAAACDSVQTGSGFIVAQNRVVTNAHVVAGVSDPVVELRSGQTARGRVVSYDPVKDLAVIATGDLDAPILSEGEAPTDGASGAVQGYPYGGPFTSRTAEVLNERTVTVADIYGKGEHQRKIYTLAANVQPGNSGGPLLNDAGQVVGVVFAKDKSLSNVGYALTGDELAQVISSAEQQTAAVSTQSCHTAE